MKLLVVVDYQNDFVDGALGFPGAELLDEKIAQRINEYGEGNVFYTLDTHSEDYMDTREGKLLPVVHCVKGSQGHAVYGKTAEALKAVNAVGFCKESFGLDISNPDVVSALPRKEDVETVELCGLVSNICVVSNAVAFQTLYPQARIIVDSALTDSFDKSLNEQVLNVLKGLQVDVR